MKKSTFLFLLSLTFLYSCTNDSTEINESRTRIKDNSVSAKKCFHVQMDDIRMYMAKHSLKSRSSEEGNIQTITYGEDTVMYLINYNNGWEVLPGDKRYPLQVAFNETGNLDLKNMIPAQKMWFDKMAEEIHFMKTYGDTIQNSNCKVWNSLGSQNNQKKARGEGGETERGGWILHNTRVNTSISQQGHLLTTHWDQGYPYDQFTPIKSTGYGHCPVGCTAVAGGQVLNYLYQKWGVPSKTVSTATYNSQNNTYSFSDCTTPWSEIEAGNRTVIARFLGHFGVLCNTKYGDSASGTGLENGLYTAINAYGIGCSFKSSWDSSIIRSSLSSGLPVVVGMRNQSKDAHTIVLDGYKAITDFYTDVYIYIDDLASYHGDDIYDHDESGDPVPAEGPTREETYSTTHLYYMINWGWGDWYADNTYYLSSDPIKEIGSLDSYYTIKNSMLYGFYIK